MSKTKKANQINELSEKIRKLNLNLKDWVILQEAVNRSIYSKRQIEKLAEKGNERIGSIKIDNTVLYNMMDILQYAANHQKRPILSPVWDEIDYIEGECFYPLFGYDNKYFVTNKQRVINATTGQVMTPYPKIDIYGRITGYRQVALQKNGKSKKETLHRLVGKTQCKNVLDKDIFHHIKIANPSIDKASNLLPVWRYQHDELHRLLNEGKEKEYKEMVKAIKKENAQKLYKIPHPDYKPDGKYKYYLFVTAEGNQAYKRGKEIPLNCIVKESAELTER